jgi:hypothetical protein
MPLPKDNLTTFASYLNRVFVETGSYSGDGIETALGLGVADVKSIELDKRLYLNLLQRYKEDNRVELFHGDSGEILGKVISEIDEPITFWLDAHNSNPVLEPLGFNTPLLAELDQIKRHHRNDHTILIDDTRMLGTLSMDNISKEDVVLALEKINPAYTIDFIDGPLPPTVRSQVFVRDILVASHVKKV